VLTIQGEKFAKQESINVIAGVWLPDVILFFIGLFFLRQARIDARLFETDFYNIAIDKLKLSLKRRSLQPKSV
jgi:lipopolysaccharide export system permease protein